jgi:hypothetical protein
MNSPWLPVRRKGRDRHAVTFRYVPREAGPNANPFGAPKGTDANGLAMLGLRPGLC